MDPVELVFAVLLVLAFIGLAVAILWPLERRRDDVMNYVHGDQPDLPDLRWPQ